MKPHPDDRGQRRGHAALLIFALALWPFAAGATAGLAEYSWSFHDRPGQWIEWHHGDLCPPGSPDKNCILVRRTKSASGVASAPAKPLPFADAPGTLYLRTVFAMLPIAVASAGASIVLRRIRARRAPQAAIPQAPLWPTLAVMLVALAGVPVALRTLFPASPATDGWGPPIALGFNVLLVLAPLAMWWAWRRLFPGGYRPRAQGVVRAWLWMLLLPSALLAPFLVIGPPNLLLLLLPPMWLPNIGLSLLALWLAGKLADAARRWAAATPGREGGAEP